jgi:transcriptional regulator with XRE-family HTH domain
MILADKIVSLRKKAGWSQEDLAEKLGVTRQSVSKWEGAQSVPDMDKVVMMSRLFGVSTDFLLKDELEEETPCAAAQEDDTPLRRVTMKQASAYLALRKAAAPKIAIATALCIISPVTLILLAGMSEVQRFPISGNAAAGIGLCVMLVLLAVAVSIFLRTDADVRDYRFLEEEPFETEYGVEGMVRQRQREYKDTHTRLVTVGVVLCVLAAVPLFAAMCINGSDLLYIAAVCALLVLVAIGCLALVTAGVYQGAMEQLLEEGDYTRPQKKHHKLMGTVTMIYWLTATAVFLLYTYGPHGNGQPRYSWIIWAVAGVLYAAVMGIVRIISRSRG